jgi:hypothetical protein
MVEIIEASEVGQEVARERWAEAARGPLIATARRYNAVITYKELAEQVQSETGVHTNQLMQHWISDVLGRVGRECASRGEPMLTSLCVNAAGSVGDSYTATVLEVTGKAPEDPDQHAAHERLACYQAFDAVGLPAAGGTATLVAKLAASRTRARKAANEARTANTCPIHHVAVPATGICDLCD